MLMSFPNMKNIPASQLVKKWSTILALVVIQVPLSLPWYWGNLSIYVDSYIVKHVDSNSMIADAPWTACLIAAGCCGGYFIAGLTYEKLGKKPVLLLGVAAADVGLLGAYLTIDASPTAMSVLIGLVSSAGRGVVVVVSISLAVDWSDGDVGLLTSIVEIAFPVGGMIISQVATLYTNPDNLVPDKIVGATKVFDQGEVVDRVPSVFLIIGFVMLGTTLMGFFLVRENRKGQHDDALTSNEDTNTPTRNYGGTSSEIRADDISMDSPSVKTHSSSLVCINHQESKDTPEFTLRQVISSTSLYKLWVLVFIGEVELTILIKYFKSYGELYIGDDHFLTNVSTAYLVAIALSRLCWGVLMDRCTMKSNYVLLFAANSIMGFVFYFSPMVNKWCYAISTLVFGSVANPIHILVSVSCAKTFGKDGFIMKYAIVSAPGILYNLVFPPLCSYVIQHTGWFGLFTLNASSNFVALVASVFLLPQK